MCFSKTHQTHTFCRVLGLDSEWNRYGEHCEVAGCCVVARTVSTVSPAMLPTLCCGLVVQQLCSGHCVGGILWTHDCDANGINAFSSTNSFSHLTATFRPFLTRPLLRDKLLPATSLTGRAMLVQHYIEPLI
jgi:hypothetical protein